MSNMILVRFFYDCGRMGDVEGLFVTNTDALHNIYGKEVYLGEILGKHSEVIVKCKESNFEVLSDDKDKIEWLINITGDETITGINPLPYYDDQVIYSEPEDDKDA